MSVDPTDVVKSAVDETTAAPPPKDPSKGDDAKKTYTHCANCRAEDKPLKACTRCRKVAYCSRPCQAQDWKYHKRVCTPPKKKEDEDGAKKRPPPEKKAKTETKKSTSAPAKKSTDAAKASSPATADKTTDSDEEDAAVIEEVKKKGYRYFARKLDDKETELIGDIKPKKVDAAAAAAPAGASGPVPLAVSAAAAAGAGAGSGPQRLSGAPSTTGGSAWNHAGTFEERDLGDWFKERLTELVVKDAPEVDVGVGRLVVTEFQDWEGSASVFVARGKVRRVFDVQFKVVVELRMEGDDLGAGSEAPEPDGKKKKKKSGSKYPKALLAFHDVSNSCDGEYEGVVEWGSPPPRDDLKDVCRSHLRSESQLLHKRVLDSVNTVVEEFMAK